MRDTGIVRETEGKRLCDHLPLLPCANTYTSHSPPAQLHISDLLRARHPTKSWPPQSLYEPIYFIRGKHRPGTYTFTPSCLVLSASARTYLLCYTSESWHSRVYQPLDYSSLTFFDNYEVWNKTKHVYFIITFFFLILTRLKFQSYASSSINASRFLWIRFREIYGIFWRVICSRHFLTHFHTILIR